MPLKRSRDRSRDGSPSSTKGLTPGSFSVRVGTIPRTTSRSPHSVSEDRNEPFQRQIESGRGQAVGDPDETIATDVLSVCRSLVHVTFDTRRHHWSGTAHDLDAHRYCPATKPSCRRRFTIRPARRDRTTRRRHWPTDDCQQSRSRCLLGSMAVSSHALDTNDAHHVLRLGAFKERSLTTRAREPNR